MKYKVRCSQLSTLISGCGKVTNKLEWKELDKFNDSHKELAIEIYNAHHGFESADVDTHDMQAGTENEPFAIQMYDEYFGTNFFDEYVNCRTEKGNKPFEMSNEYITGTRDFGDKTKTIDCKVSTDKNVFNKKMFVPLEVNYIIQLNGYSWLYNTPKLELFNALMNPTEKQIDKMISTKMRVCDLTFEQEQEYRQKIFQSYCYDFLPLKKRIQTHQVPIIENFQEIIKARVERLNKWLEENSKFL